MGVVRPAQHDRRLDGVPAQRDARDRILNRLHIRHVRPGRPYLVGIDHGAVSAEARPAPRGRQRRDRRGTRHAGGVQADPPRGGARGGAGEGGGGGGRGAGWGRGGSGLDPHWPARGRLAITGGSFWKHTMVAAAAVTEPVGRLRTICHILPGQWLVEGIGFYAGFALRWLRDIAARQPLPGHAHDEPGAYAALDRLASTVPAGADRLPPPPAPPHPPTPPRRRPPLPQ